MNISLRGIEIEIESKLHRLFMKKDEESRLLIDILRVLVIFNGILWESEIIPDILKVNDRYLDYIPENEEVRRCVNKLAKEGFIEVCLLYTSPSPRD